MKLSKNARYFWGSMIASLCAIGLFCGLVTADYNTRWVGLGDPEPVACLNRLPDGRTHLKINSLGFRGEYDITNFWNVAVDVVSFVEEQLQNVHK